jgi:hypothetical protein
MNRILQTLALALVISTAGCYVTPAPEEDGSTTSRIASNTAHARAAFQYIVQSGWDEVHAAAIVGNLQVESHDDIDPTVNQEGGGPGRGIAQWGAGSDRWTALQAYARQSHLDASSFDAQLHFVVHELQSNGSFCHTSLFRQQTSVDDATRVFMQWYERPAARYQHLDWRLTRARAALANYGTHEAPSSAAPPPSGSGGGSPKSAPDDSSDDGSGSDDGSSSGKPQ